MAWSPSSRRAAVSEPSVHVAALRRVMSPDEVKEQVVKNISSELSQINERIALRAVCNFFRADVELGKKLAESIGVDLSPYVQHME